MKQYEPSVRMTIGYLHMGLGHLRRLPEDLRLDEENPLYKAIVAICDAEEHLRDWADQSDIGLRETMKT